MPVAALHSGDALLAHLCMPLPAAAAESLQPHLAELALIAEHMLRTSSPHAWPTQFSQQMPAASGCLLPFKPHQACISLGKSEPATIQSSPPVQDVLHHLRQIPSLLPTRPS